MPPSKSVRAVGPWPAETGAGDAPESWSHLYALQQQMREAERAVSNLSGRQLQVLKGLLEGSSNNEIARNLGLSPRTVEVHRHCLLKRLEARSTADAIRIAIYAGLAADGH